MSLVLFDLSHSLLIVRVLVSSAVSRIKRDHSSKVLGIVLEHLINVSCNYYKKLSI